MNMYSFYYVSHNLNSLGFVYWAIFALIAIIIMGSGIIYFKNKSDLRFRNLFILFVLFGCLMLGLQANKIMQQRTSSNQSNQTALIMKSISKKTHTSVNKVYVSQTTLGKGMLVKAGDKYYQLQFDDGLTNYTLNKTNPVNTDFKIVNKQKFDWNVFGLQYGDIILKLLVGFIMIVLQINLSGKGNLAPSNAIDQLQNYTLGGIIGGVIYNSDISVIQFIIILLIWSIIIFMSKFVTSQSDILNRMLNGSPQVIINNGRINVKTALRQGINGSELSFKLRTMGIKDFREVKNAVLEQNGQITASTYDQEAVNYPIITDGKINQVVMNRQGLNEEQIEKIVQEKHVKLKNIYIGQLNENNHDIEIVKYPTNNLTNYKVERNNNNKLRIKRK
ncbi:DUF3290 family protein [Lactobacillus sp. S2-2]|uniref:DUF3290 family protein n=1 Tax=Lactobacillus sp. S2-2 TaxID=2692917 RepID=UPI001F199B64|nr:DUF3290 family protein [Lactobacillus sp. S2-2]MCF6514625.1 DUF3290 family protein [Lactobacillus sp. S2-2]